MTLHSSRAAMPWLAAVYSFVLLVLFAGWMPALASAIQTQTITFGAAPTVSVGWMGNVSAFSTSGLAVTFSSHTTGICTVSGSTVTGVSFGICSIAANQAGNSNYSAAPEVIQSFSVTPQPTYTLTVNSAGADSVPISASPDIYAGTSNYSKINIAAGTSITLTAPTSVGGSTFRSWSGCSTTSSTSCTVKMNSSISVLATWQPATHTPVLDKVDAGDYHTCAVNESGFVYCWGSSSSASIPISGLTNIVALAAGGSHTCALTGSGSVLCWGSNTDGQLGNGSTSNSITPVAVVGLSNVVAVSAGWHHTCAVTGSGMVFCWGYGQYGQLGRSGNSSVPVPVSGLSNAIAVSTGWNHNCALTSSGGVVCWGYNGNGMLGNDGASSISFKPVAVSGLVNAIAVSVGKYHSCAVTESGSAYCWGKNDNGQLGNGSTSYSQSTPVLVSGLSNVVAVSAGGWHSCARTDSGQVLCWGDNTDGQLGDGSTSNRNTPVAVSNLSNVVQLTAGSSHSCALNGIGKAVCWGYNLYGQLGNGSTSNSKTPVDVSGLNLGYITPDAFSFAAQTRVALNTLATSNSIAVGGLKVVAPISVSNGSYSVNGGEYTSSARSVSNGDTISVRVMSSATPGTTSAAVLTIGIVSGRFTVTTLAVQAAIPGKLDGGESHTCAVLDSGQVVCWGDGAYGKLGNGNWSGSSTPIPVNGLTNALSVSAGWQHTCAVTGSGLVFCWGRGDDGQLGNGKTSDSYIPIPVSGISNAVAVSAGGSDSCYVDILGFVHCVHFSHTCALTSDGTVLCWGNGTFGQLGNGSTSSSTPVVMSGLSNAVSISAGASYTCALTGDSTVFCWGRGIPSDLKNVVAITAGRDHTCNLTSSGTVVCWGSNTYGQLGIGSGSGGAPVVGLNNAIAITAGKYYTCALTGSGSVVCWGYNAHGQLGNDNSIYKQTTPVPVLGLSNAVSVSAGENYTCAQTGSGTVICWGFGSGGLPITVTGLNLGDITPDAFSFAALTGVALNSTFTSNMITLSGIKVATPISISNGSYSVNGGAFTSVAGNVNNGAAVSVLVNSAGTLLTASSAVLNIGGVSGSFTVTTHAANVPDPFSFTAVKNAAKASVITSNSVFLNGFSGTLPISVSGGTYSIDGQPYSTVSGTVSSGSSVTLRQASSSQPRSQTSATLSVGLNVARFDVTTRSPSLTPILMLLLD